MKETTTNETFFWVLLGHSKTRPKKIQVTQNSTQFFLGQLGSGQIQVDPDLTWPNPIAGSTFIYAA